MASLKCPSCGKDSADGLLCDRCIGGIRRDLRTVAEFWPEMTMPTVTRSPFDGGSAGSESSPLPVDLDASDASDEIRDRLVGIVRILDLDDAKGLPDWPPAWCTWISERAQRIRGHAAVADLVAEIRLCRRMVLRHAGGHEPPLYCGQCDTCGSDLYAGHGKGLAICHRCKQAEVVTPPVDVAERRAKMLAEAETMWVTKDELLTAVPSMYGVSLNRKTVESWVRRGRLLTDPDGRFRVGDVLDLVHGESRRTG